MLLLTAISFLMLAALPYNFDYPIFAVALFIMGLGNGMFGAPNIAAIMNSVPSDERGVASGMRAMLQNSGWLLPWLCFLQLLLSA